MPALNVAERDQLEADGYVVVTDVFNAAEALSPITDELHTTLDAIESQLVSEGSMTSRSGG